MCNGFNHAANCRCGWGGDGAAGGFHSQLGIGLYTRFTAEHGGESFCRPTTCPVCGLFPVYLVRHNGGSVWVDELGWPWPKHSCFLESEAYSRLHGSAIIVRNPKPCLVVECVRRGGETTDLIVAEGSEGQRYFVQVAKGIDLESITGELVIISVPDKRICHPLVPGFYAVEIGVPMQSSALKRRALQRLPKAPTGLLPTVLRSARPMPPVDASVRIESARSPVPPPNFGISDLLAQVDSANPVDRAIGIDTLSRLNILKATDRITARLFDVNEAVRGRAVAACESFGFGNAARVAVECVAKGRDPDRDATDTAELRKHIDRALRDVSNRHRQYHATILVGDLRLSSLIPALLPLCFLGNCPAIRVAVAEALWKINVVEAIPLLLLLAVDSQALVRRYAAAALADIEEPSMSKLLIDDTDDDVRRQACSSFREIGCYSAVSPPFRVPCARVPTYSPLYIQDFPAGISAAKLRPYIGQLFNTTSEAKHTAGLAALLWAEGAESYSTLTTLARRGAPAAVSALKHHFDVEPLPTSQHLPRVAGLDRISPRKIKDLAKPDLTFPMLVANYSFKNAPARNRHPTFRHPLPAATLLIVGGDGREGVYRRTFSATDMIIMWRSGFDPESLATADLNKCDAVVLVSNGVSVDSYRRLLQLLVGERRVPCAYSQTLSTVSIARTARTLLGSHNKQHGCRVPVPE